LYGLDPSGETPCPAEFLPALSLQCLVAQVKFIPAGTPVSYGATWRPDRPTRLAVLQAGYADGVRRTPNAWTSALLHGRRAPLVGAICMDLCMADVTDIPDVEAGDVAVLLGRQGDQEITVGEVACRLGTIGYEVLCGLASRVPRVYIPAGARAPDGMAVPLSADPLRRGVEAL
ncbi:MAG TPA: alanine racemase C-terminal domain-containing protein, partial [Chloroflexota bacterium]